MNNDSISPGSGASTGDAGEARSVLIEEYNVRLPRVNSQAQEKQEKHCMAYIVS